MKFIVGLKSLEEKQQIMSLLHDKNIECTFCDNLNILIVTADNSTSIPEELSAFATVESIRLEMKFEPFAIERDVFPWHLKWLADKKADYSDIGIKRIDLPNNGSGVDVVVVDSGINYNHTEFQVVTAEGLPGFIDQFNEFHFDTDNNDAAGHGTHVAGLIGGTTAGVAPNCKLYSAKVFGNDPALSGSEALIIQALNHSINLHLTKGNTRPTVVNLSLGSSPSESWPYVYTDNPNSTTDSSRDYITTMVNNGIHVFMAAGNGWRDALGFNVGKISAQYARPANNPDGITVGAIDKQNNIASFSNYGKLVDIFAPGVQMLAASHNNNNNLVSKSGTSMACPFVAGVACLYLTENPFLTPHQLKTKMKQNGRHGILNWANIHTTDYLINNPLIAGTIQNMNHLGITSAFTYDTNDWTSPNLLCFVDRRNIESSAFVYKKRYVKNF